MRRRLPDDLRPGDWVTRWEPIRRHVATDSPDGVERRVVATSDATALDLPGGVPLKIQAISLPYIVCAVLYPGGEMRGPAILDIRCHQLMGLDAAYVRAIMEFPDMEEHEACSSDGGSRDESEGLLF